MKKSLLFGALALTACAELPPSVVEYNGSSVKVRQSTFYTVPDPSDPGVVGEAVRVCGTNGKRAEHASSIIAPSAAYTEHLYLCL
ncbi:hypothetical protein KX928_12810 [Roseobacter sp. YSTF-M11]|uniref:Lipoprotein n=1 Tax=Roseobacter insulae TaxID=2859783 RepID=A0A9X1FVV3_9RHOB|nr:hypothetical protein [Roseobacter insulae]MBW4708666.1 hypothetical protein [Roseobacter insulae]